MIPFGFILADLRRLWLGALAIVLLIAVATALGMAVQLQERALRLGSARAADRFDIVVGAAGSETQLVLSAVFLQAAPLPLMDGSVLKALAEDPRVAYAAPVGFGDSFEGQPIVGTIAAFALEAGGGALSEGQVFDALDEAVVGARVPLALGAIIKPMHGLPGEGGHTHSEIAYHVVGRMAPTGTPWDRAILVPIEAVWRLHGMGDAHAWPRRVEGEAEHSHELEGTSAHLGSPWPQAVPGVPAVIVKARTIADAYRLRAQYRKSPTLAVFPAEVLVRLYGTLGDARLLLGGIALGAQALVIVAVMLVSAVHLAQRRAQIAALRALGAPRRAIFTLVWSEVMALVGVGAMLGMALGFLAARMVATQLTRQSGIVLPVEFASDDLAFVAIMLTVAALAALVPAMMAYRQPATLGLSA
ncbi:FtsX-like permease family protein [Roseixanthobacter glucoisosaccharinicivorans]|uniref:FtsX-like permease family protein n=1 Tax=Roseixanthobacter glucoisosaccharinicivorans TaxID=3119923 RepID=UPI00372AF6B1